MLVGALVPFHDTGGDPDTVREYAQALEAAGYDFLEAPDHQLVAGFDGVGGGFYSCIEMMRRRSQIRCIS
jgi:hypothetical protein